jgi:hypothetical protein
MGGSNIRHTIMPRFTPLKARNGGSIANSGFRKHLIFPNSGILTKFQCGVTKGPTRNYLRGGIVRDWQPVFGIIGNPMSERALLLDR